jgi:alkanesulfonate monooxygenase SsuD/methylene tetrahydromethanopterin reductase-like flavin-dependent oxidoreductase (luciferase family)
MDVGLLTLGDLLTDPVTDERQSSAQRHRSIVESAVLAESCGFTSVHLGEHHFCDYVLASPPVVLAAIAERTTSMRLSTGVALGVNLDPVRIAEDYATVDVLSGGRVEPCIGRGTFFPHVYRAFGQDPALAKSVFAEHIELLVRVWEDDVVTWSGQHRAPLDAVTVHPRPVQRPRPPIWLGAGASADSVELAARLGLWLMLPTVFGTPEMFAPMAELYRERWREYGHDPAGMRIGCCSHTWVAPTSQEAHATWRPRYTHYMNEVIALANASAGRTDVSLSKSGVPGFDYDHAVRHTALCGSPAEVADRMAEIQELLHLDCQILYFDMGGMPERDVMRSIELCGAEVIPAVKDLVTSP